MPLEVIVDNCDPHAAVAFTLDVAAPLVTGGGGGEYEALPSGEAFWLGCTKLSEQWLPARETVRLPLVLGATAPGTYTLDSVQVAVSAWKTAAAADAQRPAQPVLCLPPPARAVKIVERAP